MIQTELAAMIDHTLLKPDASQAEIERLCQEAIRYQFAAVCVNPVWVGLSAQLLQAAPVRVCTVIGFPLGATETTIKVEEIKRAVSQGAEEVDMVIQIGALKGKQIDWVRKDILACVEAAGDSLVKVIIETALLTRDEMVTACCLSKEAGADYVKTSTGFAQEGATLDQVRLMRQTVGEQMGVKASGGIRDRQTALEMISAGATRIGTSSGIRIVEAN